MGRRRGPVAPLDPTYVQACFEVRDDGVLCWRERPREHFGARPDDCSRFNNQREGSEAGFAGPGGKPLVRFVVNGRTRRVALLRVAWICATGEVPRGAVRPRDGNEWNAAFDNLIVTKSGARPFDQAKGGRASSLERRASRVTTLISALADHPGATVPMLSKLVGSSVSCTCTRLGKLSDMGLTCGPKCDARARWALTPAGRALAAAASPMVIDDLDRSILTIIAQSPMRLMALAGRIGTCPLTARRRVVGLIERELATQHDSKFTATAAGLEALGGALPEPWLKREQVAASLSRGVIERRGVAELSHAARSKIGSASAARIRRSMPWAMTA